MKLALGSFFSLLCFKLKSNLLLLIWHNVILSKYTVYLFEMGHIRRTKGASLMVQ